LLRQLHREKLREELQRDMRSRTSWLPGKKGAVNALAAVPFNAFETGDSNATYYSGPTMSTQDAGTVSSVKWQTRLLAQEGWRVCVS
jgi:hypothetical protein